MIFNVANVKGKLGDMNDNERQTVDDCVETIATIKEQNSKKGIIRMALSTLKGIKVTTEFATAVIAIVQFVEQYL